MNSTYFKQISGCANTFQLALSENLLQENKEKKKPASSPVVSHHFTYQNGIFFSEGPPVFRTKIWLRASVPVDQSGHQA